MSEVRLIDANALTEYVRKVEDWESAYTICAYIDNAPTVEPDCLHCKQYQGGYDYGFNIGYNKGKKERPKGEWVRKEDILHYIATQYSEHNELVPVWLSIGDLKGGAE